MSSDSFAVPAKKREDLSPSMLFPQHSLMTEPSGYQDFSLPLLDESVFNFNFNFNSSLTFPQMQHNPYSAFQAQQNDNLTINNLSSADPMRRWYGSTNEEPWSAHSSRARAGTMPVLTGLLPFTRARTTAGSDTESIITTRTTPGTAYSAYSGDEPLVGNQESQQIQDGFANMGVQKRRAMSQASSALEVPGHRSSHHIKSLNLRCPHCNAETRTPSEFKKHRLKHEKPFKCPVIGCERSLEGFTTSNDLERHKKSKHRILPDTGAVKFYKCASESCTDKDKIWPRLDNFGQHLDRMHPTENKDEMIKKAEFTYPRDDDTIHDFMTEADDSQDSATISNQNMFGSMPNQFSFSAADEQYYNNSLHDSTLDLNLATPQPQYGPIYNPPLDQVWNSPPSLINTHQTAFQPQPLSEPIPNMNPSYSRRPTLVLHPPEPTPKEAQADQLINLVKAQGYDLKSLAEAINRQLSAPETLNLPNTSQDSLFVDTSSHNDFTQLATTTQQLPTVPALARRVSNSTSTTIPVPTTEDRPRMINTTTYPSKPEEKRYRCKYCPKVLARQSALKKHQKRHERLYGCTFTSCNKTFGSKDDWKRHENSQHFQADTWQCAELQKIVEYDGATEKPCDKLFHRKEIFAEHLKRTHHITDKTAIADRCAKYHVGGNAQTTFWCGFCLTTRQLSGEGPKAWDERFNHIGDHFSEGKRIQDWIPENAQNKTKGELHAEMVAGLANGLGYAQIQQQGQQQRQSISIDDEEEEDDDDDEERGVGSGSGSLTPANTSEAVASEAYALSPTPYTSATSINYDDGTSRALSSMIRSASSSKRQRPDEEHMSHTGGFDFNTQQISQGASSGGNGHGHREATVATEIYCCQCGMGPFYQELSQAQCTGYGNCSHVFCEGCFRGVRKRARSYSSRLRIPLIGGGVGGSGGAGAANLGSGGVEG